MAEEFQLEYEDTDGTFEEKEEKEPPKKEFSTGDKILDIKLKFNFKPEEIEFMKRQEGTWQERMENPDILDFFRYQRRRRQEKQIEE